ncbi:MAG: ABC-type transporter, permease subunit [Chlamydiales bacterium]|jgi:zinc transport system permease protein|nr:ABC-type transporter, permease subunit [Chlamydiales bacterium]
MGYMWSLLETIQTNPFIQAALIAGLAASIVGGTVGSYVVVKRIAFISGSIAHCVLSGLGITLWLRYAYDLPWLSPVYGALGAALLAAFVMGWVHQYYREREDTIMAAMWSIGTAVGVVFISQTPGFNSELMNFLFGNILWVSREELVLLACLDIVVLLVISLFHKQFLAICFDEEQAYLQGIPVTTFYFLLLALIAISSVLLIQVVGTALVITMLTIPATIANTFTRRLTPMMALAIGLNIFFCFTGTALAFYLNWPPGASIAILSGVIYFATLLFGK